MQRCFVTTWKLGLIKGTLRFFSAKQVVPPGRNGLINGPPTFCFGASFEFGSGAM
jgi:hypothetical protein